MGEWGQWVSASDVRNWFEEDPLLDWPKLYGEDKGFVRDDKRPQFDPTTDFSTFLFAKACEFEKRIVDILRTRCQIAELQGDGERGELEYWQRLSAETEALINDGVEAIYQGAVMDPVSKLYGRPDLIVRSDVLARLVDQPPNPSNAPYHVVDIKFTSLDLNAAGFVGNSGDRYRKAQLLAYSRGLAAMQGVMPKVGYIIARSYTHKKVRLDNALSMLAPAELDEPSLSFELDDAADWLRRLRTEGAHWNVLPEPTVEELRPNMGNTQDSPWHLAKKEINEELHDLTSLWRVTPKVRPRAIQQGVTRCDDARCCAEVFGLPETYSRVLQCILDNQAAGANPVMPERVATEREVWHKPRPLEFYVDFETVSDLDDKFDALPEKGGQPLIFMIGCGHEVEGEWKFECFVADRMNEPAEKAIIDAWIEHMIKVSAEAGEHEPFVFHWSPAEKSSLTTAFNAARVRHPDNNWPEPNWFDFLTKVVRVEPVTVKGALAFGLKAVAKAMHSHDLIRTRWTDGPGDGLAAMIGGWWCEAEAKRLGCTMLKLELMKGIREYNEVDCKVMWEAISYLRANH